MKILTKLLKNSRLVSISALGLLLSSFSAQAEVNFEKEIWPIIDKSCVKCHKAPYKKNGKLKKPKAGLRVDTAEHIMKGSDDGKVVVPGKPQDSSFYTTTTLPEGHDDIMPAKGDPLTKKEQELIRKWIAEGAKFGNWKEGKVSSTDKNKEHKKAETLLEKIAKTVKAPNPTAVKAIEDTGALILPLSQKNPLLQVNFRYMGKKMSPALLSKLTGVKDQVTWLNLAGTQITDTDLKVLSQLKNLTALHLEKTSIGDAGLKHIAGLQNLEYLNIYGTKVSDAGLKNLEGMKNLKKLYTWQSKISKKAAKDLSGKIAGIYVDTGYEAPVKPVVKKSKLQYKAGSCCDKSQKAGKKCGHGCCVKAEKAGKACEKCNGKPKAAPAALKYKAGGCCDKSQKAGKKCGHGCCVKAEKAGKACEKCNGKPKAAPAALKYKAGSCCDKSQKAGKKCGHGCCVKAEKAGKACEKCNGKPKATTAALKFKAGSCCDKAKKAGKACGHGCCVKAIKAGKVCKKCN